MFNESIDQSIKSDSGSNYEDRIFSVLNKIGIKKNNNQKRNSTKESFQFIPKKPYCCTWGLQPI